MRRQAACQNGGNLSSKRRPNKAEATIRRVRGTLKRSDSGTRHRQGGRRHSRTQSTAAELKTQGENRNRLLSEHTQFPDQITFLPNPLVHSGPRPTVHRTMLPSCSGSAAAFNLHLDAAAWRPVCVTVERNAPTCEPDLDLMRSRSVLIPFHRAWREQPRGAEAHSGRESVPGLHVSRSTTLSDTWFEFQSPESGGAAPAALELPRRCPNRFCPGKTGPKTLA